MKHVDPGEVLKLAVIRADPGLVVGTGVEDYFDSSYCNMARFAMSPVIVRF